MIKAFFSIMIFCFITGQFAYSEVDIYTWYQTNGIPATAHRSAIAVYEEKIYLIGGPDGARTNIYIWNGASWEWGPKPPYEMGWNSGAVLHNKLYIIGNEAGTTNVCSFDGTTWVSEPAPPRQLRYGDAAVFNNAIYYVAGLDAGGSLATNVFKFDGTNWTEAAGIPFALKWNSLCVFQNKLYSFGRYDARNAAATNVYAYDGTNWAAMPALPIAADSLGTMTNNNGELIMIRSGDQLSSTNTYKFDGTNWTAVSGVKTARRGLWDLVNYKGQLWAIGGLVTNVEHTLSPDPTPPPVSSQYFYGVEISKLCGVVIGKIFGRAE